MTDTFLLWQRLRTIAAATVVAVGFLASGNARSTEIEVLDARYSTALSYSASSRVNGIPFTSSQTQTITGSPVPLDSEIRFSEVTFAMAAADMFSVTTATSGKPEPPYASPSDGRASATAQTELTFHPLQDGNATLSFAGVRGGFFWSDGFFSLYNVTAGQSLFSYSWLYVAGSTSQDAPFRFDGVGGSALLQQSSFLMASDTYLLTLHASTNANTDSQSVSLSVSGLQPVAAIPEPSTYALMLAGLGAVAFMARRRKGQTPAQAS